MKKLLENIELAKQEAKKSNVDLLINVKESYAFEEYYICEVIPSETVVNLQLLLRISEILGDTFPTIMPLDKKRLLINYWIQKAGN